MTQQTDDPLRQVGFATATSVIVANMIGTGVFTSLGFQVIETTSGFALLALWAIGGLVAMCGALAYAELGVAYPHSGGEYVYLSRLYSPLVGFLGGWISMTVGFAAPIALAALAFGKYFAAVVAVPPFAASVAVLVVVALIHASDLAVARRFQVTLVVVELVLILSFVVAGLTFDRPTSMAFEPTADGWRQVLSPGFAVSLIYVSFAFSGWNAAGYIAGEVRNPGRTLPATLIIGTAMVAVLYLLLNWTFLRTIPVAEMRGVVEVGALSAQAMFGESGGRLMSAMISMLLVATISAMVMAGSRVTEAVTRDLTRLRMIGARSANRVPRNAILLQVGITLLLLMTNSVDRVMTYAGFTLNIGTLLAVLAVWIRRKREPHRVLPYRIPGFPMVPAFFVLASVWTLGFVLWERPLAAFAGLGTLALGVALFWWDGRGVR
ncbi:MAG: amino acid permease [Gemmatimonadetes bacterium]|nr:amino acid permease [Gemmatimonadota bacterium]